MGLIIVQQDSGAIQPPGLMKELLLPAFNSRRTRMKAYGVRLNKAGLTRIGFANRSENSRKPVWSNLIPCNLPYVPGGFGLLEAAHIVPLHSLRNQVSDIRRKPHTVVGGQTVYVRTGMIRFT